MEDIDTARVRPGSERSLVDDLRWLGLDWDEGPDEGGPVGPYRQSERLDRYEAALGALGARGLTYLCDCSRAEIARAASAPHEGEEGPRYPGTCRAFGMAARSFRRPPAVRFAVPPGTRVSFVDEVHGPQTQDVEGEVGDFVLRRGDGVFAYQLAVVVDDLAMGVERVVRGADLLGSTARQIALIRALGGREPAYVHAPLVLGSDGARLAKRSRGVPVGDQRAAGRSAEDVLGALARAVGLTAAPGPRSARSLLADHAPGRLSRAPVRLPPTLEL